MQSEVWQQFVVEQFNDMKTCQLWMNERFAEGYVLCSSHAVAGYGIGQFSSHVPSLFVVMEWRPFEEKTEEAAR